METWIINEHIVEYIDETHTYLVDGIITPSITQILKIEFGNKYKYVRQDVMQRSAELGTTTHKEIEEYCKLGVEADSKELRNFKFLQKQFNFKVIDNELPVILFYENKPVACGRLDLVLFDENIGLMLGDIKRTSVLDKEYLAYQLNFYKIGFEQCYHKQINGLKGLHLREDKRKYVDIPINEEKAIELLQRYLDDNK